MILVGLLDLCIFEVVFLKIYTKGVVIFDT